MVNPLFDLGHFFLDYRNAERRNAFKMYIYFYRGDQHQTSQIQVVKTKEEAIKILHADFLEVYIGGYEGVPPTLPDNYLSLCGWWIEAPLGKPTETCSHFSNSVQP